MAFRQGGSRPLTGLLVFRQGRSRPLTGLLVFRQGDPPPTHRLVHELAGDLQRLRGQRGGEDADLGK